MSASISSSGGFGKGARRAVLGIVDVTTATLRRAATLSSWCRGQCGRVTPLSEAFQAVVWHCSFRIRTSDSRDQMVSISYGGREGSLPRSDVYSSCRISAMGAASRRHHWMNTACILRLAIVLIGCALRVRLIVVTNQPDVGRRIERDVVQEMHRRLAAALPVDAIMTFSIPGRIIAIAANRRPG